MRKLETRELQSVIVKLNSMGWLLDQSNSLYWQAEYILEPGGSTYRLKGEPDNIEGWEIE